MTDLEIEKTIPFWDGDERDLILIKNITQQTITSYWDISNNKNQRPIKIEPDGTSVLPRYKARKIATEIVNAEKNRIVEEKKVMFASLSGEERDMYKRTFVKVWDADNVEQHEKEVSDEREELLGNLGITESIVKPKVKKLSSIEIGKRKKLLRKQLEDSGIPLPQKVTLEDMERMINP